MDTKEVITIIGMVLTFVLSVGGSIVVLAVWKGQMTEAIKNLTSQNQELKVLVNKLSDKIDNLTIRPIPHTCLQEALLGALTSKIDINTERFLRLERRVHTVETSLAMNAERIKALKEASEEDDEG